MSVGGCLFAFINDRDIYTLHKRLIRFHPSGIFDNGGDFAGFSTLQSLLPVFFGGNLHHFIKMPVEITQRTEACHNRNIENRMVCVTKQVAGIHNPDSIQVIQGTGMHNSLKASSEMGRAHMA